jgi:peptide subunit release factor 1 (eRF1)
VFCSGAGDLFEVIRLPRSVQSEVVISDSPFIEPLVDLISGTWCILLCNRRTARVFRGSSDRIEEVARVTSEDVPSQTDAGGWSQLNYERGQDEAVHRHLKRVADLLHRRFRRARFDHLLVGSPEELTSEVERMLHPDVAQRLAGRLTIDVENTTGDAVFAAARPLIEDHERTAEREALDRLKQGVGAGGRGVAGLEDALGVLNERRVETLLIEERFQMPGRVCPQCGSLYAENVTTCPADETPTDPCADIVEEAVELAVSQAADVIIARHHDDLEQMGGVGAVLRF